MPVCTGVSTDWRSDHAGRDPLDRRGSCRSEIGPLPSIGSPSALTTRPISASPTGTETMRPVARTSSPSSMLGVVAQDDDADRVLFEVQRDAHDARACVNSTSSLAMHVAQAVDAGDAVADLDHRADVA